MPNKLPVNANVQPIEGDPNPDAIPVKVTGDPGATITANPDVAVAANGTSPLTVPPSGTRRMTVQNTGPATSVIRVRQLSGLAGSGIKLPSYGSTSFGGADGAIEALEAQDVTGGSGVATTVGVTFEGD